MKKILCFVLAASLMLTPTSIAFAKPGKSNQHGKKHTTQQTIKNEKCKVKVKKLSFKISGSPVIKYGRYKLPINPITKGMGATVNFDKATGVLTVAKDTITLVINFSKKTVTVNGVEDANSGIFKAKNDKKMTVLIKYIANVLGVRVSVGKGEIIVEIEGLDYPTNVTVTPVGSAVVANKLNSTSVSLSASANIVAGQATGGKAELYVGNKLVATDTVITATDTIVTFTTADDSPTNAELQAAVPKSGVVTVRLYNANQQYVTSKIANPTLVVDYVTPTFTAVSSAAYNVTGSSIILTVTGASTQGDNVDVTKISIYDTALNRTYQLTNASGSGSTGIVRSADTIAISLGLADRQGLVGFGTGSMVLTISAGSLLSDLAGNVSVPLTSPQTVTLIKVN